MSPSPKSSRMPALPATISMLAARPARGTLFSSLRFRLLLAILVPFIAASSLIVYEALDRRWSAIRHSGQEVGHLLDHAADQERQAIDHASQLLTLLAQIPSVRRLDAEDCAALFAEIRGQNPRYAN